MVIQIYTEKTKVKIQRTLIPLNVDPTPPPLRSGHLDIKHAQCAETKDVLKKSYHIITRFRVIGFFARSKMRKNSNFLQ